MAHFDKEGATLHAFVAMILVKRWKRLSKNLSKNAKTVAGRLFLKKPSCLGINKTVAVRR